VLDEVNADVVVTYDPHGYYGHPDHIHTHRVTRAALEHAGRVRQLWYPVTPTRALDIFRPAARDAGVRLPAWVHDAGAGVSDAEVDFTPDTVPFAAAKHAALAAHASQIDNADLLTMPADLFTLLLGQEYYQCAMTRDGAPSTHIEGLE
jgi:N-acetyl-1-D-myo-inositol-2-amino-2-deoxy-alpha-D-glucopyranoside deacetylase